MVKKVEVIKVSKQEFKILMDKVLNETDLTKQQAREVLEKLYTQDIENEPNIETLIQSIKEKG